MGTRLGGIGDERLDDPLQVPRVERHAVMHARASERPDPALGPGIRMRSPHRCPDRLTPKPLRPGHAVAPVGAVAVSDQRARAMVTGRGLDQLLPGPGRRGMGRDGDVLDAAPRMRDDEEDGHRPDRARRDGAAVRRPDDAALVGEEGPPSHSRRNRASAARPGCAPRPSADSPAQGGESDPAPRPGSAAAPAGAGDSSRSRTGASRCDANARPCPDGGSPGAYACPTSDGGGAPSADDRPRSRAGGARTASGDREPRGHAAGGVEGRRVERGVDARRGPGRAHTRGARSGSSAWLYSVRSGRPRPLHRQRMGRSYTKWRDESQSVPRRPSPWRR